MHVFNQRCEALFPWAGALGCAVCFAPPKFLPVYLCASVGPQGLPATTLWDLLATAWPSLFHNLPPCWVHQSPSCRKSSPPRLPISVPPMGLDECFFFISLAVGLPYSSIFCQFWLFFAAVQPQQNPGGPEGAMRHQCMEIRQLHSSEAGEALIRLLQVQVDFYIFLFGID